MDRKFPVTEYKPSLNHDPRRREVFALRQEVEALQAIILDQDAKIAVIEKMDGISNAMLSAAIKIGESQKAKIAELEAVQAKLAEIAVEDSYWHDRTQREVMDELISQARRECGLDEKENLVS